MALLSFDDLMVLAQETPLLCDAEDGLRKLGKKETADQLEKLVQDAGVQMDPMYYGVEPPAGPQTAALYAAYKPVDHDRFYSVMAECVRHLDDQGLKQQLTDMGGRISKPAGFTSTPPAPPTSGR